MHTDLCLWEVKDRMAPEVDSSCLTEAVMRNSSLEERSFLILRVPTLLTMRLLLVLPTIKAKTIVKVRKIDNKNSRIQDQARLCFHYQKKTYEQVIELKDVLIARQQSEKQSDVSKYTRWQQLKVSFPPVKHQSLVINCRNRNEILRQPR